MEEFINYLVANKDALWATISAYFVANILTILGFSFAVIKLVISLRAKEKETKNIITSIKDTFSEELNEFKADVQAMVNESNKQRIEKMEALIEDVKNQNNKLEEATEVKATEALESLD